MNAQPLADLLNGRIASRNWGTAFQACVVDREGVVLRACGGVDGSGRPVSDRSMFPVYCAGKPLLALILAGLVDQGELSWDDRVGDLLDEPRPTALDALTVEQILSHRAGLSRLPTEALVVAPPSRRRELVLSERSTGVTVEGAYSDVVGWELLALAATTVADRTLDELLADLVTGPLGTHDSMAYTAAPGSAHDEQLRINVDLSRGRPVPLLWERSACQLGHPLAATGLVSSMGALATTYAALLWPSNHSEWRSPETVRTMTSPATPVAFDHAIGREAAYGLGFMVNLSASGFGTGFSAGSFGHSGLHSITVAGADPELGIAFGVHVNGALPIRPSAGDTGGMYGRLAMIATLLVDIGTQR